ncbi:AlwI family type II restriction endonuclease [Stomatobaculum longum]|uniref:AlwI family type II restriction endonuclease n=1 Tax=Stomatobaculum longum TaxID=796942 RepID=UPI0028F01DB9|nr:AlwI family type II restriction endonuclease [Stomatobaculum longum]
MTTRSSNERCLPFLCSVVECTWSIGSSPCDGMFIAVRIDTNTAETFRHGIWYAKGDVKQRLDIVPFTLAQFQKYFVSMFESKKAEPIRLRSLIAKCKSKRDLLDAPTWKKYIEDTVTEKAYNLIHGIKPMKKDEPPIVPAGAIVYDVYWGEGQVVALIANFPEHNKTCVKFP